MIPVAIYARVSSEQQAKGESIDHQISMLKEYVVRNLGANYHTDESLIYKDEGISGYSKTLMDRPAIQRMFDDAKEGKFKIALFKEISRMGRDGEETMKVPRIFESYGVRVLVTNDYYDSHNPDTKIVFSISSVLAEKYSDSLSSSVSSGQREKARSGQWATVPPLGYTINKETKRLEIDDETAFIPRLIFEMYVDKKIGTQLIANELNERGLKTIQGNPFEKAYVRGILKNQAYIGHVIYGKNRSKIERIYDDNKNLVAKKKKLVPREDFVHVKNAHPALVDEWTFWKAQEIMSSRATSTEKSSAAKHPLVGITYCARCGKSIICQSRNMDKKYSYRYYKCSTVHRMGKHGCDQNSLRADKLEEFIYNQLLEKLTGVDFDSIVAKGILETKTLHEHMGEKETERKRLVQEQLQMTKERDFYTEETFRDHMLDFKRRIEHCEQQIHIMQQQLFEVQSRESNVTHLGDFMEKLQKTTLEDREGLRSLFHDLIERIEIVDADTIGAIKYRYSF